MLQLLLPDVDKYFLWSATASESLFSSTGQKGLRRRTKSNEENGIHEGWNGIWDILKLNKGKKEILISLQENLREFKTNLQTRILEFLQAKNKMWDEAEKISNFVNEKGLSLFSSKKTIKAILWILSVFFCSGD